ncbi:TetR/AcrR family transcriptional regulator [Nocardia mexicana]|uniref:TetR/AcrR family transcriptional regulator n=1 Tax=Nocardia mexicana TaxID=279262 RepID=UPI0008348BD4|nr:TetR/AcrR family transcriptional regulator [Nocardia mexicana]
MKSPSRVNRGPAAAAGNRAAILRAAREVFLHNDPHVPLARISDAAGVGPAVLYRHFPDRESLARAMFAEDVERLEAVAARPGTTLEALLDTVIEQTVHSAGLLATLPPESPGLAATHERVREIIAAKLATGDRGGFAATITAEQLMLAVSLLAGLLTKTPQQRRNDVAREGWQLLLHGLR